MYWDEKKTKRKKKEAVKSFFMHNDTFISDLQAGVRIKFKHQNEFFYGEIKNTYR